jgi:hypothetical protein
VNAPRPGWNPVRRNRNIGTAKSGRGLDNRLVIPSPRRDMRAFWEALRERVEIEADGYVFCVEPCRDGFVHAVTIGDALRVLAMLPSIDTQHLRLIVFRQPTRKQRTLSLVWGRLAYRAEVGRHEGPAIILEAQPRSESIRYGRRLGPEDAAELTRLRRDGHIVTPGRRGFTLQSTMETTRNTQLYRTLPHELGHYVQYRRTVDQATDDAESARREDLHFSRPPREKEAFAHRYADEFAARVGAEGRIPFERVVDEPRWRRWGLEPSWFGEGT